MNGDNNLMNCLKFTFALLITFFLISAAYGKNESEVTKQEMGNIINLAGKQRMLTQKMSKEILLIAKGINVSENVFNLHQTASLFNRTLAGLAKGDSELGLVKIENSAIARQLYRVYEQWKVFLESVNIVLTKDTLPSHNLLKRVAQQNLPLLKEMDKAVKMYERESRSPLDLGMAVTINLAGKQRMLTQRITKELLLVASDIEPAKNQKRLARTVFLFERTLVGLLDSDAELGLPGTKDVAIRNQLIIVKKQWDIYKIILTKSKISDADLVTASQINIPLLKEMNKAVQMYADSVK